MAYRTDIKLKQGGGIELNETADTRKALPDVELPPVLLSGGYKQTIMKEGAEITANDPAIQEALNLQVRLVEDMGHLLKKRDTQPNSITQAQHLKSVSQSYNNLKDSFLRQSDLHRSRLEREFDAANAEFAKEMNYTFEYNEEIRSIFRGKAEDEQRQDIIDAIERKDGAFLNAVLNASPYTVGLSSKSQSAYRSMAMKQHRPDLVKKAEIINKTQNLLLTATDGLLSSEESITANRILSEYERQDEEARQAADNASFSQF